MTSIRIRLLIFLLLAAAFTALIVGTLAYRHIIKENQQLFDYQLRQMALSLRDQGAIVSSPFAPGEEASDVVVQIWANDGQTLYLSRPDNALPDRAVLGFTDLTAQGRQWRVYSFAANNRIIQVAQPFDVREDLAAAAALRSITPLLVFVPLMAVLIWWLVGRSLSPLTRLAGEVQARDANTLTPVSEGGIPAEIAPVVGALNALLGRLKQSFNKERAFVADAAHELRSPLTALKLQLQLYARAADAEGRAEALDRLNAGVDRATHLVEQLLTLARNDPGAAAAKEAVNLAEVTRQAIADLFPFAQARHIHLELDAPEQATVFGNAGALRILVRNLVDNSVRYTPENGYVRGAIAANGGQTRLTVEDSGPGIPDGERERVFDRFYRRDEVTQMGSGLGLAIVKSIVEQHGAQVALSASPLGGLRVGVVFDD